jgi:septal ring factor EnvC (AmiA/AmiB activator)
MVHPGSAFLQVKLMAVKAAHAEEVASLKAAHAKEVASLKADLEAAHAEEVASLKADLEAAHAQQKQPRQEMLAEESDVTLSNKAVQKLFQQLQWTQATLRRVLEELTAVKAAHAEEVASLKADLEAAHAVVRAHAQQKQAWREILGVAEEDGYEVVA